MDFVDLVILQTNAKSRIVKLYNQTLIFQMPISLPLRAWISLLQIEASSYYLSSLLLESEAAKEIRGMPKNTLANGMSLQSRLQTSAPSWSRMRLYVQAYEFCSSLLCKVKVSWMKSEITLGQLSF